MKLFGISNFNNRISFGYSESCWLKVMGRKGWCKDGTYKNRMQNSS